MKNCKCGVSLKDSRSKECIPCYRKNRVIKTLTLKEKYESKVIRSEGCWSWTASIDSKGYGKISHEGRFMIASRVSWILHRGDIPKGFGVLHRCDNPPCTNPDHLFLGTQKENMQDAITKGRFYFASNGGK